MRLALLVAVLAIGLVECGPDVDEEPCLGIIVWDEEAEDFVKPEAP